MNNFRPRSVRIYILLSFRQSTIHFLLIIHHSSIIQVEVLLKSNVDKIVSVYCNDIQIIVVRIRLDSTFHNYFHTCDHLFLCRILDLSFKWQIILFFPGRVQTNLPPYGVGNFFGGRNLTLVRWTSDAASSIVSIRHFTNRLI